MKLILKVKPNKQSKNNKLIAWIQKDTTFKNDIIQLFKLFKDNIHISKLSKILRYHIVTSENPAIILNLFSSIQELIPEVYFNKEDSIEIDDIIDI